MKLEDLMFTLGCLGIGVVIGLLAHPMTLGRWLALAIALLLGVVIGMRVGSGSK